METERYEIRSGGPRGPKWGWAHTLDRAELRASKMSRHIRTDIPLVVVRDGAVISTTGTFRGPGGVHERDMQRIA